MKRIKPKRLARLARGEILNGRKLVVELIGGRQPYLWIGCADGEGQHCIGTFGDRAKLRKFVDIIMRELNTSDDD